MTLWPSVAATKAAAGKGEIVQLRARCRELEKKLGGTKARVQRMIKKIEELER